MKQTEPANTADRPRWHRRARHALAHSLRVRLVAMFVLLAMAMAACFLFGMQSALSVGWRVGLCASILAGNHAPCNFPKETR